MVTVVVVGMGSAGSAHARFCMGTANVDLIGIVDPQAAYRAAQLPDCVSSYASLSELWVSALRPDVIIVCSPPAAHYSAVRDIISRGIACICEKPLAIDVSDGIELVRLTRGVVPLVPVHNYKYAPWWSSLKTESRRLGNACALTVRIERQHAAMGVEDWSPQWRMIRSVSGGGILWDFGVHALYLAQDLFKSVPISAQVKSWRESFGCEVECDVRFDFRNGCTLRFAGNWGSSIRKSTWTADCCSVESVATSKDRPYSAATSRRYVERESPTGTGRWLAGVFDEYVSSRVGGLRWRNSLEAATLSILALDAARRSARNMGRCTSLEVSSLTPLEDSTCKWYDNLVASVQANDYESNN